MTTERIVKLFAHGGGLSQETWKPIIRRVMTAPLLQRVKSEVVTFDWRYHGANHRLQEPGTVHYLNGDEGSPRVSHTAREWTHWAPRDLHDIVKTLRREDSALARRTRIVGIGHSMGACSIINLEIAYPGTFDGIIAFEPVCNEDTLPGDPKAFVSKMVANTLQREHTWDSWDDVATHFKSFKAYRRWHDEAVDAYLEGCVVQTEDGKFRLACDPVQEASLYCHDIMKFTVEDHSRLGCKVVYEHGEITPLFNAEATAIVVKALPDKVFLSSAMKGVGHMMVLEDPVACAERIIQDLEVSPVFQHTP
ncbi:hypothetical protein Poli38472_008686 [Pythium oligandrum]|uniref:AB hydrolase-1 domain-containing protein n=1 Tax=Pythium oligandrum TaxID=41045 RepID=A0A8K1FEP0_PYTOL|nr:hypothetical protein Poli38472_008686 [Pythium oligandrum]|eukprot:TMW56038.1 hypothetical protein Poli38472_008686 [Pythium oligandrum]